MGGVFVEAHLDIVLVSFHRLLRSQTERSRQKVHDALPKKLCDEAIDGICEVTAVAFKRGLGWHYLAAAGALLVCMTHAPIARGDSASCLEKVSSYVAELDELLSREKNWITPYFDLNERYFPFRDCEADALLEEVRRSRFIQPIDYHPGLKKYFIVFASDEVRVGFTYLASEKKSQSDHAGWVHK